MEGVQKKACARCRTLKMKCDRVVPTCTRCQRSGQTCHYVTGKVVRFRNETKSAEHRAVNKWRARAKVAHYDEDERSVSPVWNVTEIRFQSESPSDGGKQHSPPIEPRVQYNFAIPVEDLARTRILHDFVDVDSNQFFRQLGRLLPIDRNVAQPAEDSALALAFSAVSLGNFHKRQHHEPSLNLAWKTHGKALTALSNVIQNPGNAISYDVVLMAIFLGIFQNIYQDSGLKGAWILHLKGAIDLLKFCPPRTDEHKQLSMLLMKMTMAAALRLNINPSLPPSLSYWLHQKNDLEGRSIILCFRVAALAASCLDTLNEDNSDSYKTYEQMASLEKDLNALEADLKTSYPFQSSPASGNEYPTWYWPVSKCPGGPQRRHSYGEVIHGIVWNNYRMARLKLLAILFHLQRDLSIMPEDASTYIDLIDAVSASVYHLLTRKQDGKPAPASFDQIPSAKAMQLISPLNESMESLERHQELAEHKLPGRIEWIRNVVGTLKENIGIAEPLVIGGLPSEGERRVIQELFQFDEDT